MKLHVLQARSGDCLLLEGGAIEGPRYVLIDGGPARTYAGHLRPVLQHISSQGGVIDLAVVSHIDDDHIHGLLDLLSELGRQRRSAKPDTIGVRGLWHNTFGQMAGHDLGQRFWSLMSTDAARRAMALSARTYRSIAQGDRLSLLASSLGIPINPEFAPGRLVCSDDMPVPLVFGDMKVTILGPSRQSLGELRDSWADWLQLHPAVQQLRGLELEPHVVWSIDRSIPNLSSIMFLAESAAQSMLFLGDGSGDQVQTALGSLRRLDSGGRFHASVLKLPHHGSAGNVTTDFLKAVTADIYVISGDGEHGNPDQATLEGILFAARDEGREFELVSTNASPAIDALRRKYPPGRSGYRLSILPAGAHSLVVAP